LVQWYRRISGMWPKVLWWLVIGCMLLSLPLAADRFRTEESSKRVEFVFDYRDLLEISDYKPNPKAFVEEQLKEMKKAGIRSLAVYESTLTELKLSRKLELYNSREAAALTQTTAPIAENFTYVLFTNKDSQEVTQGMVEKTFSALNVRLRPWTFKGVPGLVVELPQEEATLKPLGIDPVALKSIKDKGFDVIARLGNKRPEYVPSEMEATLQLLNQHGVHTLLFDGDALPGFAMDSAETKENLKNMAGLLTKYKMALAIIELQKTPQKGFTTVAKETDYNVIRLHSFTENDAAKLVENITKADLDARIKGVSDRLTLAVKDRNIRLVFLNARASKNVDRGVVSDPLGALYRSLGGPDGAVKRIQEAGFTLGPAHSFDQHRSSFSTISKGFAVVGSVALIALTLSYFVPLAGLFLTVAGLAGAGALYFLNSNLAEKLLALGVTICAAALGIILAIRYFQQGAGKTAAAGTPLGSWLKALAVLLSVTAVSGLGIVFVVGLLNEITYPLLIEQFKGVKILAYMPILLAAVYLVFFSEALTPKEQTQKAKQILNSTISVLWVITVGAIGAVGFYYLSRTGNEGVASPLELAFRGFLENTMGVRPRSKEFLMAHPLLLFGAYLCFRRQLAGLYLILLGAIGQASVIGTFTHLHTPLMISFLRVVYGLALGAVIGLALIAAWEILTRGWRTWVRPQRG